MSLLIYGAYGYTGRLVTEEAARRGLSPILAGRDAARLRDVGAPYGFDHVAVALDDPTALEAALGRASCVLHCAGPFRHTAAPMVAACLATGTSYLDITGEIGVFEQLASRGAAAADAGIVLLPGVGFDVVPTDCLALHLKQRLPSATSLDLAIAGLGGVSRGTATTALEGLGHGGASRRDGRIEQVPAAWKTRTVDFGRGAREVVSIPWGDVSTAYYSTGIPDVTTYAALGRPTAALLRLSRHLGPVLRSAPVRRLLRWVVRRGAPGPSAEQRRRSRSFVWGQVRDDSGATATARLALPDGYTLTAHTAVSAAERVRQGDVPPGFQTPARAFGADFILSFEGAERFDLG